ncbi:glycosyltransferase family 4 protein [Ancylomarina sp. 16SWW S1-10-2]|uniref:glycosyltransferase family 4 protein n=1 Tax=Ancylomarina sp. 16SWW S1-10-2 TaxID=2499681 RepID=UPI0012AE5E1F|nr:glycosyltransferase family 4 protein [Ancylomarina sp. 16SWW S1-10-2]MRT93459.1 glycosyltransferase family 4 protein [Ancylomarina sp. 16SWW S1-10-2]
MGRKILYITNQICGPGGLERVLSIKASYLADLMGYEVHILTLNQGDEALFYNFSENLNYHDVSLKGNPLEYIWNYRKKIRDIIKKVEPDIISVCDDGLKGLFAPWLLGKFCPMVYERHVSKQVLLNTSNSLWVKWINRLKFRLMDVGGSLYDSFISLTKDNTKEWNLNNIKVISNPLSFYPDEVSKLENKEVIAVGRLFYQKGYPLMIETWEKIAKQFPDWHLNIYGAGPDEELIRQLIKDKGLDQYILIHKPTPNILEKYQNSSIYLLSSLFEGFGMVLIEAMACGVPCVSFDCPCGPADIIIDNEDGYLVEAKDVDRLADRLKYLIKNEGIRKQMGEKARENVKRYLPEVIVPMWDTLFTQLIQEDKTQ